MFGSTRPQITLQIKKWGDLIFVIPLSLPILSWILTSQFGLGDASACMTILFVFGVVPVLDILIGKDASNPDEQHHTPSLEKSLYYPLLTLSCVPAYLFLIIWGAHIFSSDLYHWAGKAGWVISIGVVGGLAITVAHELIHKNSILEQTAGGLLLAMVGYGGFKVEHIRGHHVNVATPEDASSSHYNQSLYHFLPRAIFSNIKNAWRLEQRRLARKGLSSLSLHNELIWWYGVSAALLAGFTSVWGLMGALFFVGQGVVAILLLETVNYLEHYGLHRCAKDDGGYERVTHQHSWNSNYLLTNLMLFQLQRHSDHHANAKRRYQALRHFEDSPQLPAGYATMVLLALAPPLWRRVMNPKVNHYYQQDTGAAENPQ
ncbi:alkane 1-monooxygenase [Hahella sp. KA22]|uniref:alkane 1-monooxygenase n=1 Tax=Hahella sp. KA22 TaxID=1628392 RepID=UPI000FDD0540|nr:alkane 1-monooxygenase [Hahella sp. KA22]AZZ91366.1 alkane 1-monooxygenase [Hahella sp. KA22]QAY54736.1 alkane 1-monooxygenase [Hahella sp. KA22]